MAESKPVKQYVLGFVFTSEPKGVLLLKKSPRCSQPWQADMLNGVGGLVEKDETPADAMLREGREEAGIEPTYGWVPFGLWKGVQLDGTPYEIHLFACRACTFVLGRRTAEPVALYPLDEVLAGEWRTLPDVAWLIQLALYCLNNFNSYRFFTLEGQRNPPAVAQP